MTRVYLDTNVFVYALGREHRYREPCRDIVERLRDGQIRGEISVQVVQEFAYVRGRRSAGGYAEAARLARQLTRLAGAVHAVEPADLSDSLSVLEAHRSVRPNDALHASVALNRGLKTIVTADRHFDRIAGIERIDPLDSAAVAGLGG